METTSKVLLVSAILLLALTSAAEGGRKLKDEAEHPPNFIGGFGSGTFSPTPDGGLGYTPGPAVYCSFPGNGCVPVGPIFPGGSTGSRPTFPPGSMGSRPIFPPGSIGSRPIFPPGSIGSRPIFPPGSIGSRPIFPPGSTGSRPFIPLTPP